MLVDPFSKEAKKAVKEKKIEEIEEGAFEHARRLIEFETRALPEQLKAHYDEKLDILAQHLLLIAAGLNFSPYSKEFRFVKERIEALCRARIFYREEEALNIISERLSAKEIEMLADGRGKLNGTIIEKKELFALTQSAYNKRAKVKYGVNWRALTPLLRAKEIKLTDLYIVKGYALLSLNDLIDYFAMLVGAEAGEYLLSLYERAQEFEQDRKLAAVADLISQAAEKQYKYSFQPFAKASKLNQENFPPCIKIIISGVSSGSRNFAITVLLTSFLSYARIAPPRKADAKIADYAKELSIVTQEILPLIYEAAQKCNPPLFQDQPLEKQNIIYHLGFGLTSEPRLENSGSSKWYFTPNCEKIRRESPGLCKPDELCARIKNPLTYYFAKQMPGKEGKTRGAVDKEIERDRPARREKEAITKTKPQIKPETKLGKNGNLYGKITRIQDGSGLIQRCPKCDRWIIDNFCVVHSDVEGIYDLRIKAEFEDENGRHNLIFKREETEKAVKITLEEAKKMGAEQTLNKIKESVIGKTFEIEGTELKGGNFLVKSVRKGEK